MMKNTRAFVLKINPKGETSAVVHVYSRDFGKLILIAKGARRDKSPFKGLMEPFSLLNIHFNEKPGRPYQFLSHAEYVRPCRGIKQDTAAVLYGSVILELLYKVQEDIEDRRVFALLSAVMEAMDKGYPPAVAHAHFILRYLKADGRPLETENCYDCGTPLSGTACFHPLRGHMYCRNCVAELSAVWELPAALLSILKGLSEDSSAALAQPPAEWPGPEQIDRILWNTLAARFENCRTLRSVDVLRKVL
jgi:DNA repair protein RecO (recombination protein O)